VGLKTSGTPVEQQEAVEEHDDTSKGSGSFSSDHSERSVNGDGDWIPGQDVQVDHPKILEILVDFLSAPSGLSHSHLVRSSTDC
jgi:vacuole morphology and inheritance protein 14